MRGKGPTSFPEPKDNVWRIGGLQTTGISVGAGTTYVLPSWLMPSLLTLFIKGQPEREWQFWKLANKLKHAQGQLCQDSHANINGSPVSSHTWLWAKYVWCIKDRDKHLQKATGEAQDRMAAASSLRGRAIMGLPSFWELSKARRRAGVLQN